MSHLHIERLQSRKNKPKLKGTRKQKRASSGSKIYIPRPDMNIKPGDDFYHHINQYWLNKVHVPPTKTVYGVSEEIEEQIDLQSQNIVKECIRESQYNSGKQTIKSMIGILAQSVLTCDQQTQPLETLHRVLQSIQSLQNKEEVGVVMGEFIRYNIRGIFNIFGQYENKNDTKYTYTIGVGGLGLPDPSYYYSKSIQRGKHLAFYRNMLKKCGKLLGIPNLHCAIKVERILAGVLLQTDVDLIERKKTGKDLEETFRYIPFESLFVTMGLTHWRQRVFYVESTRWLHTLNKFYHHLGLDHWKLLLSLEFILFCLPWLPPQYSKLHFQMFRKQLRGQQQPVTRQKQSVYVVQGYATNFFSRLYVETINPSIKSEMESMLKDMIHFTKQRLGTIEWLEPPTRKKAQEKVDKMRYIVAYPDNFEDHKIPLLQKDNVLYNLLELGQWFTDYEIQKLGQPITQRKEWDDAVFAVNAYYYGQANEIVIPAGILNPPFYDQDKSIAWNYGGIGCTLCHEITHAFDKEGKDYDPQGFQKRWWTPLDNRRYNEQSKDLIDLYSKQKVFGFPVSGKQTLSENIADIGGMGIALDALKHKLDEQKLTQEDRNKAFRDFFISYAISWRLKDKKRKRLQALIMDRHAPASLRVNLVVSQFQEWYDSFDVKPGDKLYLAPEKRIQIF